MQKLLNEEFIDKKLTWESSHWEYIRFMNTCYMLAHNGKVISEIQELDPGLTRYQLKDICSQLFDFVSQTCEFSVPTLEEFLSERYSRTLKSLQDELGQVC